MRSLAKSRPFDHDLLRVGAIASIASVFSLLYYFQRNQILLYGDAVAHINIARRVFDSQTPGPLQLGTVWLPLPHVLMIPFLLWDALWISGVGGSIPSMIAYVFGVIGVFRLARGIVARDAAMAPTARIAGAVVALVYGANPNLIYLQTTAMTEPLSLAFMVWSVVFVSEFLQSLRQNSADAETTKLWKGLVCLAGAELTRYDGWFLAAAIGAVVL